MKNYFELLDRIPLLSGIDTDPIKVIKDETIITNWQNKRKIELAKKSKNSEWADIGIICNDPFVVILRDLVEFPDGNLGSYIRLYNRAYIEEGAAGVVTLPEKDGMLLLMHNFRHATRAWHWEIPRGFGEPGVDAEEQAKAELSEEIGVNASDIGLVNLGVFYSNTGLEGHSVNLFLAHITSSGVPNQEIGVDELRWVSVTELEKMIADGEITDGFTIAAYTKAKLKGLI